MAIAEWLNQEFARELAVPLYDKGSRYGTGPLFQIDRTRSGDDKYGGIFWYDPRWEPASPPDPRVKRIFAHTNMEGPMIKKT